MTTDTTTEPTAHVCTCKYANARARSTDRYDEFEYLFIGAIKELLNDIRSIGKDHIREEHSTPAPARYTKAYSELEAKKIQESAHKILAMTECFFQESKKLADQVAVLSRHTQERHGCSCNVCSKLN